MRILLLILFCALSRTMSAQAIFVQYTQDTIQCYRPLCPHSKTYQETFTSSWDGCLGFENAAPATGSFVLMAGENILLDTCIETNGDGIPSIVCWQSLDTLQMIVFGPDSSTVAVWHLPGSGNPSLGLPIVNTDTLCSQPVWITQPQPLPDPAIIDIITMRTVTAIEDNRVYLVGQKRKINIK